MSDFFNALNPRNDLSCPNIHACIDAASQAAADAGCEQEPCDLALEEISRLLEIIKAQREQMDRTDRAMADYAARDKKHVDQLCDIRDTLKAHLKSMHEWTSGPEAAIREVLKKHFSLDLDK
jgi:DnaJ-domain-containing protein 1